MRPGAANHTIDVISVWSMVDTLSWVWLHVVSDEKCDYGERSIRMIRVIHRAMEA